MTETAAPAKTIAAPTDPGAGEGSGPTLVCRFCGHVLDVTFVDLGMSPLCESYVTEAGLDSMEPFYPLHVRTCPACLLVQLPALVPVEDIFREYAYFSSYSDSWVEHGRRYAEMIIARAGLTSASLVVELASNDGYLLQHFVARGIPVLGVEPALNVAAAAVARGIPTITEFFGPDLAAQLAGEERRADLVVANNVLAHVPDLNGFLDGIARLLKPTGLATFEFPHVVRLIEEVQFDTIYHEHLSYFSLSTVRQILAAHGLTVVDVEELSTHGGSLRVYATPGVAAAAVAPSVGALLEREKAGGYDRLDGYAGFAPRVQAVKRDLLSYLIAERRAGRTVAGYGAPGKGNTLLNYCGIRADLLDFTVDRNPYKQGRYTPGTHIPILDPAHLETARPDVILILPWNLRTEIVEQLRYTRTWGARLVVPIPTPEEVA
jgi:SAM-dependent methyltransferase